MQLHRSSCCPPAKLQQAQVLRFYACWDDSRRPYGDKMPYVIHYFLADHTMEVREVRLRNDGRDPFPLLVRRMPIPKKVCPSESEVLHDESACSLHVHAAHAVAQALDRPTKMC
jgi:hypothetical protein